MKDSSSMQWLPQLQAHGVPVYQAIADALARDIAAGTLVNGARLPTQRSLAAALGIDFTTVSRAYAEAARRGLISARVGQGTFVTGAVTAPTPATVRSTVAHAAHGLVDMSMNQPPMLHDAPLRARVWQGLARLEQSDGLDLLLHYRPPGGNSEERQIAQEWLKPALPEAPLDQLVVCAGAQGALLSVLSQLTEPGDTVCVEALTYPGMLALAKHLRLRLLPLAMDEQGVDPQAFEAACRNERPKAFYCMPTVHNPCTITLPLDRRQALVRIARHHGVPLIEDDAYGRLQTRPLPTLGALGGDITYHIAGVAKSLSPALRLAYLKTPDAPTASRVAVAVRATAGLASPLSQAMVGQWLHDGTAAAVLQALRQESAARLQLARQLLASTDVRLPDEGFHAWLRLPAPWTSLEFGARLRYAGIGVVGDEAFAVGQGPQAVRLALGAAASRDELARGLQVVVELLHRSPTLSSMVV